MSAATVIDQVLLLKRACGLVYALAPHAKHVGQEFLRNPKLVSPHSVTPILARVHCLIRYLLREGVTPTSASRLCGNTHTLESRRKGRAGAKSASKGETLSGQARLQKFGLAPTSVYSSFCR